MRDDESLPGKVPIVVGATFGGQPGVELRGVPDARRLGRMVAGWSLTAVIGVVVVLYALFPIFQARDQHKLLGAYAAAVRSSSLESSGFYGFSLPTQPPPTGTAVGIVEIGSLKLQEVVVEGVGPAQTSSGPGHVPGTAGLGQAGNAALVARHTAFGGPFSGLTELRRGESIVVTTTEGQSLYVVQQVRSTSIVTSGAGGGAPSGLTVPGRSGSGGPQAPPKIGSTIRVDDLYGPSADNRLTLVTSASLAPWNSSQAVVVVARMKGLPFEATPQQSKSPGQDGLSAASGVASTVVLAFLVYLLVALGAVVIHRRSSLRTAYLLTTAPLVVATILLAVAMSRMLPAWT